MPHNKLNVDFGIDVEDSDNFTYKGIGTNV